MNGLSIKSKESIIRIVNEGSEKRDPQRERFSIMADTKKMTRYEFIDWATDAAHDTGNEMLIAAAEATLAAEEKKRNRAANKPKTPSKASLQNRAKALEIMAAIADAGNEPRGSQWIGEHVSFVETAHKVAGKMNIARGNGWVTYGEKIDGRVTWYVTDAGLEELAKQAA